MSTNLLRILDLAGAINTDRSRDYAAKATRAAHAHPRANATLRHIWRELRGAAKAAGIWGDHAITREDQEAARAADRAAELEQERAWYAAHQGEAGAPVATAYRGHQDRLPAVGATVILEPMVYVYPGPGRDDDEVAVNCGQEIRAVVTGYGAHWSDQPAGLAGYWVQVEFPRPAGAETWRFA